MNEPSLDQLGLKYATDKASSGHNYLVKYEEFLKSFRHDEFNLIEIGGLAGASLLMWREYFPKARIICLDLDENVRRHATDHITVEIGNSGNPKFLQSIMEKYGSARVILDDGSHRWDHMRIAFRNLYKMVEPGGIYIVEDLHTNYEGRYAGHEDVPFIQSLYSVVDLMNARADAYRYLKEALSPEIVRAAAMTEMISFVGKSCILRRQSAKSTRPQPEDKSFSASPERTLDKISTAGKRDFIGFKKRDLDRLLHQFESRILPPPKISIVKNAQLTSITTLMRGNYAGGVTDSSGYRRDLALHRDHGSRRKSHVIAPESAFDSNAAYLERAWFGGYLFGQYGHFLLEGSARILSPEVVQSSDPIVFLAPEAITKLKPYMAQVFGYIGIDPARIILCGAPLRVGELRVQDASMEVGGFVRPSVYGQIKADFQISSQNRLLYLSRTKLDHGRRIANEEVLEAWLRETFNAEIIYPETLDLPQQIEKIGNAKIVIGCEGSAFHTILLLHKVARMIILCAGAPNANYLLCDEVCEGDVTYAEVSIEDPMAHKGKNIPWSMDVERAMKIIEAAVREA
jgi:capsular polysaccharide biosynthesis protein